MSAMQWDPSNIGIFSICVTLLLLVSFRKKIFGLFDPLSVLLMMRLAPIVASLILMLSGEALNSPYYLLAVISTLLFWGVLYHACPEVKKSVECPSNGDVEALFRVAVVLLFFKISILLFSSGPLPIFGGSGSDSFIDFNENNKVGASLLLAIGSSELVLLAFIVPLTKGRIFFYSAGLLALGLILTLASGKKSSLLFAFFSISLGEYLRVYFVKGQKYLFLQVKYVVIMLVSALVWSFFIYYNGEGGLDFAENESLFSVLDFVFFQWAYPAFLFSSGELAGFFQIYDVNRAAYLFHSVLSPLGFPAFSSSIGPSLHEYQTGNLTGNGTNPTFLLEGYVLFGMLMPLYAFFVAIMIGKIRTRILTISSLRIRVLLSALFLQQIGTLAIDALLFMKILWGLILLSPVFLLLVAGRERA